MAYTPGTFAPLSSMANVDCGRHFTYKTTDSKATCVASGYFDDAAANQGLKAQDVIWAIGVTGGTEVFTLIFVDAVSAAGVVTTLSSTLTLA